MLFIFPIENVKSGRSLLQSIDHSLPITNDAPTDLANVLTSSDGPAIKLVPESNTAYLDVVIDLPFANTPANGALH